MTEPILSVRSLCKRYDNTVEALTDVSFSVQPGEFVAVIGASGSGKSTLLRCLNRLLDPSSGEISFENRRIERLAGHDVGELRKHIAMIFQSFNLIPRHSVLQNVLMGRLAHTPTLPSLLGLFRSEDRQLALEHLRLVGIEEKANVRADQLSGGQQQRVAIARALTQKPKVLLADEPVASLDPESRQVVMDYLRKVNGELGITIVCSLHSLELVREYASRVVALKSGRVVFDGPTKELTKPVVEGIYS